MSEGPIAREVSDAARFWWLAVLTGVLSIVAGIIVLIKPDDSLPTLAVISGIFILVDGVFDLVTAIALPTPNRGLIVLLAVLSMIVGALLIRHPVSGVVAVALLLGVWLIAAAVVRLVAAFDYDDHRWRRIAVAVVLGAAGVLILSSPNIGFATLALFTGLGFIAYGLTLIAVGWGMRVVRDLAAPAPPPAAATT